MFGDMMSKLQDMKRKVEETKAKLDTLTVNGEADNGKVKVTVNGNRKVKSISIQEQLTTIDKEELEDLLIVALNRALEQAEKINEAEMAGAAKGILPGGLM